MRTVLYVVDGLGLSGKTTALVELACRLDATRFRAEVCRLNDEPSPLVARLVESGVTVHTLNCPDGVRVSPIFQLMQLMRARGVSVVHCYNQRPMLYGGIAGRVVGVERVIASLSAFACLVPDRSYPYLPQPLSTRSLRNVLRNRLCVELVSSVVTVSPGLAERYFEYNGIPRDKLRVIAYGVDVHHADRYSPAAVNAVRARFGAEPEDVVVGSVGRLVEQKDYDTQLEAFARVARSAPRLWLVIAGDGPLRPALEARARRLGVAERVVFLGHTPDVPLILRASDVFLLSSKFEPYGVALLEAMAAGCAVVATRVDQVPEVVEDEHTGLLVAPGRADESARAIERLVSDARLRRELGNNARAVARRRHDIAHTVAAYQALYDRDDAGPRLSSRVPHTRRSSAWEQSQESSAPPPSTR